MLDHDLAAAARAALAIPRARCRAHALRWTWDESARQFYANIEASLARAGVAARRTPHAPTGSVALP